MTASARRWAAAGAAALASGLAVGASAQTDVGKIHDGGLHWHVSAPQGAAWALECGFRPVTMHMSQYDRQHWANRFRRQGQGSQSGRLPSDNGRCTLTRTGGAGPVGIALVKNGVATAAGTNDPARPASIHVF